MISLENNVLKFNCQLTKKEVPHLFKQFDEIISISECDKISFENVTHIDTAGVVFVDFLKERIKGKVSFIDIDKQIEKSLQTFSSVSIDEQPKSKKVGFFESIGGTYYKLKDKAIDFMILTSDIFYWALFSLWNKKGQREGSIIQQSIFIGINALPIVILLSLIIGVILALQSATQLKQFGANIYIANLLAISMTREMGPMMTAIIIAGRSGSSIASEVATMKVTEEIDALRMMAINPLRFIIVPKFFAMSICMPLLVIFSILVGIFGGLVIAVYYLDLSPQSYIIQCVSVLAIKDFVISLVKSLFFSWVIVIIGAYNGLKVQGGAEGVGKATTQSVVSSIFAVIVWDAFFSLVYMM